MTSKIDSAQLLDIAQPVDRLNPPKICAVPGCERDHLSLKLCRMHYQQLYRYRISNTLAAIREQPPKTNDDKTVKACTVSGCDRPKHARGLCKRHYARHARHNGATW